MTPQELSDRTKRFALRAIRFSWCFGAGWQTRGIARQLARSSGSVFANYRAARRGRSHAEFIAKLGTVCEEADETLAWLELVDALGVRRGPELAWLQHEADELVAIFSASQKTAKANR